MSTQHPKTNRPNETYRDQLNRLVNLMVVANKEAELQNDIAESPTWAVKMFVDGNLDKRFDKIDKGLEFVGQGFDDMEDLILRYMREVPSPAYDTGSSDAERMLAWIVETFAFQLTEEQHDLITCQRARHAVENTARANRLKHVRFQELCTLAETMAPELGVNPNLQIYLNPIHTWARFISNALIDDDAVPPVNVLFFAVETDVSTAVLEEDGQALIKELAEFGPCTLDYWSMMSQHADRDELIEVITDLVEMGLVALG